MTHNITAQTITDALPVINALIDLDKPVFIWGAPGIGKSDLAREIAKERNVPLVDFRAVLLDPVDLRGIPSVDGGITRWNPPSFLPDAARDGLQGLLFIDELNAAPPMVQAALFQLVLDRKLGEYTLPEGWRVVAAGNRQSDRAAAQRMPSALANRFAHVELEADVPAWCAWAAANGIRPELIAFLRFRPALLHDMPKGADLRAFPTPRAWAAVSKALDLAPKLIFSVASSLVGEACASEFKGFLDVYKNLPRIDAIINDPTGTIVPLEPSARYAIAAALSRAASHANFAAIVQYLARMPTAEFSVMAITDATRRDPALKDAPGFAQWAIANQASMV